MPAELFNFSTPLGKPITRKSGREKDPIVGGYCNVKLKGIVMIT